MCASKIDTEYCLMPNLYKTNNIKLMFLKILNQILNNVKRVRCNKLKA